MTLSTNLGVIRDRAIDGRPSAMIIPMRPVEARRFRRYDDDGSRGQILLYTGVRYERMAEPEIAPAPTLPAPKKRKTS